MNAVHLLRRILAIIDACLALSDCLAFKHEANKLSVDGFGVVGLGS
jgi:hypothetical protein